MRNDKTRRLLKSNSYVGHYFNKVFPKKLTQKLHFTIIGNLTYCFKQLKFQVTTEWEYTNDLY